MQPYPRAPDLVWPGHLHGTGCLSARAVGTGFPTVGLRLWLGPGCGWSWVLFTPARFGWGLGWVCLGFIFGVVPLLPAVCGVRGWALVSACFRDPCGFVRFSLAPRRFRFRCAVWACVLGPGLGCAPPFLAGLSGCVSCAFFFFFSVAGCPRPGPCGLSPRLLSFGLGCWLFFFFFFLLVSVPLFPVGRCFWLGVTGFGWVVPLCLFGGPVFGALWVGGLAPFCVVGGRFGGCGVFSRAPRPPVFFFLGGGGGGYLAFPAFAFPRLELALWLVRGVVGPSPLLAEVPVCYSPPLLAGFRCRGWWAVPAMAGVCRRRWCVVCGGGVLVGLWLVCGVVGPSPLLAEVPVCYSPPLLAGFRCRWWWAVPATPGWGLPAAVVCGVWRWCVGGVVAGVWCGWSLATPGGGSCVLLPATPGWVSLPVVVGGPRHSWLGSACGGGVWCVVCGGGVLVGLWLVCGVVGPSPLLAVVPVCYSPPLLAGFRCRWWWAVPATPGWGPLAAVVCGVWCVVCGGGVLAGLWLVCGVVGPSPLLAEVPVCYSPPLLAGFRCRWWCAVPATPGWGPLAASVCGVWRWCVGGVLAGVWCGWSLATPGGGPCVLLPATPGWVSLPLVVGGPRHSWLGSIGGGGVWCVVCGVWCVVGVPRHSWRRFLCATPRHSWLGFAAAGGGRSPPLLAGVRWRRWCACFAWPGRTGRPPGRVLVRLTFSFGRFVFLLCLAPSGLGLPLSLSLLLPFFVGWGLWCVGWLLPGTRSCAVVRCVLCALSGFVAPGGRRCLAPVRVPWLWPAACLSGVPRGPAWCAAPRPVRSLSVLRSAFPTPWCLSPPRELAPPALLGGCAGYAEAGREPGSLCLPLAPAEAGALGSLRVVPVRGPAMGLSLAGPSDVGLGLRALRWLACVDPVTDASGFPYRPSFDGGLGRCTGAVSCGPPLRATPARKGARRGSGAGSPRPHGPHPGHTGRGTPAARCRGWAAGGGTAPDTRIPSQRWQATPPRGRPPTTPAARSPHRACRPRGRCWAPTSTHPRPRHVGGGPQQAAQWAGSRGRGGA